MIVNDGDNKKKEKKEFDIEKEFEKFMQISYRKRLEGQQYKQLRYAFYAGIIISFNKFKEMIAEVPNFEKAVFLSNFIMQLNKFTEEPI